jgi:hypothetical protein
LNPSENISQLGLLLPIYGKHVPNHQPEHLFSSMSDKHSPQKNTTIHQVSPCMVDPSSAGKIPTAGNQTWNGRQEQVNVGKLIYLSNDTSKVSQISNPKKN